MMVPDSAIVGFVWVLTAISGIIVVARSVMKVLRFRSLAWEDALMIISLVCKGPFVFSTNSARSVADRHTNRLSPLSTAYPPLSSTILV